MSIKQLIRDEEEIIITHDVLDELTWKDIFSIIYKKRIVTFVFNRKLIRYDVGHGIIFISKVVENPYMFIALFIYKYSGMSKILISNEDERLKDLKMDNVDELLESLQDLNLLHHPVICCMIDILRGDYCSVSIHYHTDDDALVTEYLNSDRHVKSARKINN